MSTPEVTVVVVAWQNRDLLGACLDSLAAQSLPHRVLVVDNASTDGTADLVGQQYPEADLLRLTRNTGFAGGVQAALDHVPTPYLALLNSDARADPDWLATAVAALDADGSLAAVTPRVLLASSGAVNNAGVALRADGYGYDIGLGEPAAGFTEPAEVFGFCGAAAVLRTSALRGVGGFPSRFFLYYEDTDTSWRMRLAGWQIRYVPDAVVNHLHSASTDQKSAMFAFCNERNRLLMLTRCAPWPVAIAAAARFPATTASLALQRRRGRAPAGRQFEPGLRFRVLASYLRLLPWALSQRYRIGRAAAVSRQEIADRWLGEPSR